jgi:hypothetical protein
MTPTRALKRYQPPRCSTRFLANRACSTTNAARFKIETGDKRWNSNSQFGRKAKLLFAIILMPVCQVMGSFGRQCGLHK